MMLSRDEGDNEDEILYGLEKKGELTPEQIFNLALEVSCIVNDFATPDEVDAIFGKAKEILKVGL